MYPFHLNLFGKYFYYFEGVYYVIAVVCGYFFAYSLARKQGVSKETLQDAMLIAVVSGVLGARIFQLLFYTDEFTLSRVFSLTQGGLSITGAVVLGPLFTYFLCKWKKIDYWKLFTIVVPAVLFAQGVGRIGCFLNGDAHGVETQSSWGITFPKYATMLPEGELWEDSKRVGDAWEYSYQMGLISEESLVSAPVHATQLYEAFFDFLFAGILYFLVLKIFRDKLDLRIAPLAYLAVYSLVRIFIEFFRADSGIGHNQFMTSMQWTLVGCLVVSCSLMMFLMKKKPTKIIHN